MDSGVGVPSLQRLTFIDTSMALELRAGRATGGRIMYKGQGIPPNRYCSIFSSHTLMGLQTCDTAGCHGGASAHTAAWGCR